MTAKDRPLLGVPTRRAARCAQVDDALRPPILNHTLQLLQSTQDGRPLQVIFASATADTAPVRRAASQLLREPLLLRLLPASDAWPAQGADGDASDGGGDGYDPSRGRRAVTRLGAQLPSTITHGVYEVAQNKRLKAVHALYHTTPAPRCLVFVNSVRTARGARAWRTVYGARRTVTEGGESAPHTRGMHHMPRDRFPRHTPSVHAARPCPTPLRMVNAHDDVDVHVYAHAQHTLKRAVAPAPFVCCLAAPSREDGLRQALGGARGAGRPVTWQPGARGARGCDAALA